MLNQRLPLPPRPLLLTPPRPRVLLVGPAPYGFLVAEAAELPPAPVVPPADGRLPRLLAEVVPAAAPAIVSRFWYTHSRHSASNLSTNFVKSACCIERNTDDLDSPSVVNLGEEIPNARRASKRASSRTPHALSTAWTCASSRSAVLLTL